MKNNKSYKDHIIWINENGYWCALGGLMAETLHGIKKLINEKYNNYMFHVEHIKREIE